MKMSAQEYARRVRRIGPRSPLGMDLSAVLTTLGWYQKLAAKAGAGSLVPITGFANAVVSAAIEFKTEGRVLGTGAKMFTIAGPVIVYGTLAAVVYGTVLWALSLLGMPVLS